MKVVITGAAAGIGRALVEEALARGDQVVGVDIVELPYSSERLRAERVDVVDSVAVRDLATRLQTEWGVPEVWINNAGIVRLGSVGTLTAGDFEQVMRVNYLGVVHGTQAALSVMDRGVVANVGSLNGMIAAPYLSAYSASKHAVVGFTRSVREEQRQSGSSVRIALVSPGFVRTQIMESNPEFQFPKWLGWMVDEPAPVAREILKALRRGDDEVIPTLHAKVMTRVGSLAPDWAVRSSRLLTARSWRELLGMEKIKR